MITPSFGLTATERVLPSMALDFTTASLDSRVTFTRSGNTATVVNSSGLIAAINANLPRFDFDPVTLACKGLLIEEAKTNLFTYSNDFSNVIWTALGAGVAGTKVTSPDGTANATPLIEDSSTGQHTIYQISATTGSKTFSVYAKNASGSRFLRLVDFNATNGAQGETWFNLLTGTVAFGPGTIVNAGNGFYRCSITTTTTVLSTYFISISTNGYAASYTGDGTSGFYIYGAQLEAGPFATSYIPTVASQVTRTADVATMTGTNFSSWYNQSEGAFVSSSLLTRQAAIGPTTIFSASDNTSANMINCFYRASGALGVNIFAATVAQLDQTQLGVTAANTIVNTGVAYKVSNTVSYANGTVQTTSAVAAIPTVTQLQFGISPTGSSLNGYVRSLRFYKQRILNAEGQAFSK